MKIYPREPDLATIYNRIKDGSIDLQPDFQRDLVWNKAKKQSFIDTILREWQFPAVFLVVPIHGEILDVLDGQQRLNAIYEFFEDKFEIDGNIEPLDEKVRPLHGLRYSQLPSDVRNRIGRYSVRVCELTDYREEEPYELFFRLNQGTVLTPAEKRNTLYGPIREQVRNLVGHMELEGLNIDRIGFNNNRLSYQDVISRLIFALKVKDVRRKITDQMLVELFRSGEGVQETVVTQAKQAISSLSKLIHRKIKLNKPTLFTWLVFLSFESIDSDLFYHFDELRMLDKIGGNDDRYVSFLISTYQEKSASSVYDSNAVQLRLLILYLVGISYGAIFSSPIGKLATEINDSFHRADQYTEDKLVNMMQDHGWGLL